MDAEIREMIRQRADDCCEYCRLRQEDVPFARFQIEHIRARQHRGTSESSNLALACERCNAFKGPNLAGVDPQSGEICRLFNPREQSWDEHFEAQGPLIVGRTDVGRATVEVLT